MHVLTGRPRAVEALVVLFMAGRCLGPASAGAVGETPANTEQGRSLFNETCAHCHGPDARSGLPERNLRHLKIRYGDAMRNVFQTTVTGGRLDKGMPAWGEVLDQKTIDEIYHYIETIQDASE